jgi:NitT/TauT family transport system ATP-binding protein
MIRVEGVRHRYATRGGADVTAIEGVDFEVRAGEFVSLIGPSGCGKSTLLRVVGGLLQPSEGAARLDGEPVRGPRPDVAFVFQQPTLLPWRTVLENVLLPLQARGRVGPEGVARARDLVGRAGLAGFEARYPSELSGGMQQRVALCRALVCEPRVLLMDEPFGALDAMTREQMNVELLSRWERGAQTVLFVTHSISEAVFLSDRVIVLSPRPGRIVADVAVGLPRPRDLGLTADPAFGALVHAIRTRLGAPGAE